MKTFQIKKEAVQRSWHLLDAKDKVLGRIATQVANLLMGKHKTSYTRHIDTGDYVVVINAEKVVLTGKKKDQKVYRKHSGYPGGLKTVTFKKLISKNPSRVIELAVKGMLPDNRLLKDRIKRLKVFADENHPYQEKIK